MKIAYTPSNVRVVVDDNTRLHVNSEQRIDVN